MSIGWSSTAEPLRGIVLFGPPASGKDVVTAAMHALDRRICHFRKLKVGTGRSQGYRIVSPSQVDDLLRRGLVVSRVRRYGNEYVVDQTELESLQGSGCIPVIHTADLDELERLSQQAGWRSFCLWASLRVTRQRLSERGDRDTAARLDVRSYVLRSLAARHPAFDRVVITDGSDPTDVAYELLAREAGAGSTTIRAIISDPDLVVPVLTLRNSAGDVDWEANAEYATRAYNSGVTVLVAGTTGQGAGLNMAERERLGHMWMEALGADRVILGLLQPPYVTQCSGVRPLIVPASSGFKGLTEAVIRNPGCVAYSRASLGWTLPIAPPPPNVSLPFAVKLTGTEPEVIMNILRNYPPTLRIWHGKSTTARAAWNLGADAIVAAPLATAIGGQLPETWEGLFELIRVCRMKRLSATAAALEDPAAGSGL